MKRTYAQMNTRHMCTQTYAYTHYHIFTHEHTYACLQTLITTG